MTGQWGEEAGYHEDRYANIYEEDREDDPEPLYIEQGDPVDNWWQRYAQSVVDDTDPPPVEYHDPEVVEFWNQLMPGSAVLVSDD